MKKLIALTLLLCITPLIACADTAPDAMSLQIKITRGERSKDSNASTVVLTLSGQKLVYTMSGRRMGGRAVAPREFKLTSEDKAKLIRLIKDRNLLRTDSIERPRAESESGIYFYFELSIKAAINGGEGLINIKGSRKANALQEEKLYKDAVALIEELYRIMGRTDSDMVYEPLIN